MYEIIEKHYLDNFDTLVKRFKRRAGTEWDAEDIVQEAYYKALKYHHAFQEGMDFKHWFMRITINVLKDHLSAAKGTESIEFDEELIEPEYENYKAGTTSKELRREISTIEETNNEHGEVLTLYYIYGFKLREINQIVDMKYKNIDLIIQRFRKQMKEKYN